MQTHTTTTPVFPSHSLPSGGSSELTCPEPAWRKGRVLILNAGEERARVARLLVWREENMNVSRGHNGWERTWPVPMRQVRP